MGEERGDGGRAGRRRKEEEHLHRLRLSFDCTPDSKRDISRAAIKLPRSTQPSIHPG